MSKTKKPTPSGSTGTKSAEVGVPDIDQTNKLKKPTRTYPIVTVNKSLVIAQKLKEKNGGNAWSPKEIREAIEIRDTNKFFYVTKASRDFGFTSGTRDAQEIALTDFGRSLVYAPDAEIERRKKVEAFLKIDIFRDVLAYYQGSQLPEMKYLSNTLEDRFKLAPEFHEEFSNIFSENCKELGITTGDPLNSSGVPQLAPASIVVGETRRHKKML